MKRAFSPYAMTVGLILLFMPVFVLAQEAKPSTESQPRPNAINIARARREVSANIVLAFPYYIAIDPNSLRFTHDSFEFDATLHRKNREHFKVDLKNLEVVFAKRGFNGVYRLKNEAGKDLPSPLNQLNFWEPKHKFDAAAVAETLAAALNQLRAAAGNDSDTFTQQAATWRALSAKPPIPEEVRAQRLLAENAVKEKQLQKALNHYETGLELYPTWPQGCFNAALIAAELGRYADAVEHMQAYLELVPDAPDGQSARDQIIIWRDKSGQLVPAGAPGRARK